ncbi:hypothetical protein GCM10022295_15700 [Streptomyces osmaniensis]|uniref:Uncharacterized protein n=1 Tax=Streptomyces osmaniensis TaxID=593134 RepID=A0ABP6VIX6_9ACTN
MRCGVHRHGATPRGIGAAPSSTISRVTAGCQGLWAPITVRTAQARHIGQVLALAARRAPDKAELPGTPDRAELPGTPRHRHRPGCRTRAPAVRFRTAARRGPVA